MSSLREQKNRGPIAGSVCQERASTQAASKLTTHDLNAHRWRCFLCGPSFNDMFTRRKSFRGAKEVQTPMGPDRYHETSTTSALIPVPPAEEAPPVLPPTPVEKKEESNNKPAIPPGIIPTNTERVLVVGKFVVMTADVENCDTVIVQGNLDGTIRSKYIVITKGGCVRGKVECDEADVSGSFEGMKLTVHHRLTLSTSARVGGTITYNRLAICDGAVLTGELVHKPAEPDSSSVTGTLSPATEEEVEGPMMADDEQGPQLGEPESTVWNSLGTSPLPPQDDDPSETQ